MDRFMQGLGLVSFGMVAESAWLQRSEYHGFDFGRVALMGLIIGGCIWKIELRRRR